MADGPEIVCDRVLEEPLVWRVRLDMRATFLSSVNVYVVRSGDETLVVDAGTSDPGNDTRLMRVLLGLGVDPARTTLFCTHAHADHTGLAPALALAGARVVMSEASVEAMRRFTSPGYRDFVARRLAGEGFGRDEAEALADVTVGHVSNLGREGVACAACRPGDVVRCGGLEFRVVAAPGHMPGQCVLWLPSADLVFLGDAVLFACSTCVSFWDGVADSMGDQLSTLRRIAAMGVGRAFVGHGDQTGDLAARCLANVAHHERRSARALAAVREESGILGRDVMGLLGWHVPYASWDGTPAITRWFLASESIAHLDHLVAEGLVARSAETGANRYVPIVPAAGDQTCVLPMEEQGRGAEPPAGKAPLG